MLTYRHLTVRIKLCLAAKFSSFFLNWTVTRPYFLLYTLAPAILADNVMWVKHWGPAPTVPSCLYELVTHSATYASRSQSQAHEHLCTSEYISVSLRVLELSGEFARRTLEIVKQPVGALSGLTYRTERHVLLFACPDCCHMSGKSGATVAVCSGEVLSFSC